MHQTLKSLFLPYRGGEANTAMLLPLLKLVSGILIVVARHRYASFQVLPPYDFGRRLGRSVKEVSDDEDDDEW